MYKNMAFVYDELMDDIDYEGWFNYIRKIFSKYEKNPKSILEMACGTGNLSYYLAREGYDLTCFDISSDMLSIAYNKLYEFKNVTILKQDMTDFNLFKKFDCILSVCDSINYIIDEKDLVNAFKRVREHLKEDGIFIFDINSYYKLKNIIGNNIFVEDREDVFYTWLNNFHENENIVEFYLTFFIKDKDGLYRRFDEDHIQKAYTVKEIADFLKEAGFSKIDYFDAFTFIPPKDTSERINFVAFP